MTSAEPFEGMRVVVLGLARSGEAAARALLRRGVPVAVLDSADTELQRERAARLDGAVIVLGREDPDDIAGADLVVASPGVRWSAGWIKAAFGAGIPVWSEIELAFRLGIHPAVAITGTNGKTTTTEMVANSLTEAGISAVEAGNVGTPLTGLDTNSAIVAELSSFQLQGIDRFRSPVTVLLNVARDHLDWHGSVEAYVAAKQRIFENAQPGDSAIVHEDCTGLVRGQADVVPFSERTLPSGGAGVEDGWIVVPQGRVVELDRMRARGRPNRADAVAAAAAACALGADPKAVGRALASYEPKPHRIEPIATIDGVSYMNDSKATDPHATLAALEELSNVVLIAGGRNKGLDLSELATASERLRAVVAIGESASEIEAAFAETGLPIERAGSIDDAVERAGALAKPGDTVLLSPACASFDMFVNYEARGEAFRAAVKRREGRSR